MKNHKKAEDHSRNVSRTETSEGIENAQITLNVKINKNVGFLIQNVSNEPTIQLLDDCQYIEVDTSKNNRCKDEVEDERVKQVSNKISKKLRKCLSFNSYLHRTFIYHYRGRFTVEQLCCLFQFFNGCLNDYTEHWTMGQKFTFLEYIDIEGKNLYDLGDVESFKKNIKSISDIEFDVISNFIVEQWNTNSNFELLFQQLAKN